MPDVVVLLLAAFATAVATGIGAIPVVLLGERAHALRPYLWGAAAGLMGVASVQGLLLPASRTGDTAATLAGVGAGVTFFVAARWALEHRPDVAVSGLSGTDVRRSILVFGVLLVHSLPEGLAIGTAFAADRDGLGIYVLAAIALQNVPEGTATAIPMHDAGFSGARQIGAAVLSSMPQPVGALVAFVAVEQVQALLPFSFAFAAGAMLALVIADLLPQALTANVAAALTGTAGGAALMLALGEALAV